VGSTSDNQAFESVFFHNDSSIGTIGTRYLALVDAGQLISSLLLRNYIYKNRQLTIIIY